MVEPAPAVPQDAPDVARAAPRCACPPAFNADLPAPQCLRLILREKLNHFTANLDAIAVCDDPECVHQARVGWRRFASSLRFYRPLLPTGFGRQRAALAGVLAALRDLRELDVAVHDCLPPLAAAYAGGDAGAARHWQRMLDDLSTLAAVQRTRLRQALRLPGLARALAQLGRAVERLPLTPLAATIVTMPDWTLGSWARQRLVHMARKLRTQRHAAGDAEQLHRLRIRAKRLRYEIESLAPVLPRRLRKRGLARATRLQARIGRQRDLEQAAMLIARWPEHAAITSFLRGLAAAGRLA